MRKGLVRDDSRVLIHFDYDCFYASVVEHENPALKFLPLAIQQKQIVVTCNYEARRRGLRKLQLISEAKKVCPEAVIVLGEDLTRFRNASKELYNYLRAATWSDRAERLGFDEVWLDVTDMIDYNIGILNQNDLSSSFFCLDRDDPTRGFEYDASNVSGPIYPSESDRTVDESADPTLGRLVLGSHLATHLRHELETEKGYTATVGISTNKILSKLVGNVNKPCNQTTLLPPYEDMPTTEGNVVKFLDPHEIGKIPGIGFKLAQKIRAKVLGRDPKFEEGLIYGGTRDPVTVREVRLLSGMGPEMLEDVLSGPGSQRGIGGKVWDLLHGVNDAEVGKAKRVPSQISQEDSYMKYLHTFEEVRIQLLLLAERLIKRMHLDLMEDDDEEGQDFATSRRWLAHPRTLRLSTRPRAHPNPDGTRARASHRISRSVPFPNFALSTDNVSAISERLVEECLVAMFRKLHPEKSGWNLSLVNIAVTNMAETAADTKDGSGRDIERMFKKQEDVLKDFRVINADTPDTVSEPLQNTAEATTDTAAWDSDSDAGLSIPDPDTFDRSTKKNVFHCEVCQNTVPSFAASAHMRFHDNF